MKNTIIAYKAILSNKLSDDIDFSGIDAGFVLSNKVSGGELVKLTQIYRELKLDKSNSSKTLFTREEFENSDIYEKALKQIMHYYSYGTYGICNIELENKTFTVDFIKVVTLEELKDLVYSDIYANKPISEDRAKYIVDVIKYYNIGVDADKVLNNEIKTLLAYNNLVKLSNGDDILRLFVYMATQKALLIKSDEVLDALTEISYTNASILNTILFENALELSKCFNRHKKIFMALKNNFTRKSINRISKLSKKNHQPIIESINKTFINKYLSRKIDNVVNVLDTIKLVDKLKYINLILLKKEQLENNFYIIRNGKMFYKENKLNYENHKLSDLYNIIMDSIKNDLKHLEGKTIKYPANIDYAVPVSEKQSVGELPYGTRINASGNISIGVYWKNSYGAKDLDLSKIDITGIRQGWGDLSTYSRNNDFQFSGDIINAQDGAMEFFTKKNDCKNRFIFINSIYSGDENARYKIVVGETPDNSKYIENAIVELNTEFSKRTEMIGAYVNDSFIIFKGGIGSTNISSPKLKAYIPYVLSPRLLMSDLLEFCGARLVKDGIADYDLTYNGITFKKLQDILLNK